jgi:hypothetical protein
MRLHEVVYGWASFRESMIISQQVRKVPTVSGVKRASTVLGMVLLLLLTISAKATNWYVVPNGAGSKTGVDWNNAWSGGGIGTVSPGDTIWVAGGTYSSFSLINKKGKAGNQIQVLRVRGTDPVPTSAAGWNSSFDSLVVITPTLNFDGASYVTFDGRTNYGIQIPITGGGQVAISGAKSAGNSTNVFIYNVEIPGPFPATGIGGEMDGFYWGSLAYNASYNIVVSNCFVHGFDTFFKFYMQSSTITRCKLWDSYGSSGQHPDIIYFYPSTNFVFSYNSVSNINAEGIFTDGKLGVLCGDLYFFGNTFQNKNSCQDIGLDGSLIYFVNNTIYDSSTGSKGANKMIATDPNSLWANNLMCYAANSQLATSQSKYNTYCAGTIGGYKYPAGEVGSTAVDIAPPFTDGALHIVSTIANGYPRNAGMPIAPTNGHSFNIDPDGNDRTGKWSVGAYEFASGVIVEPVISGVQSVPGTNNATLTWKTDQGASSIVNYGLTSAYGASVANSTLVTSHSVTISSLTGGTLYHYQVVSVNSTNGMNASGDYTFTTMAGVPPTVSAIVQSVSDVDPNLAGVQIYYGSVVQYSGSASDPNGLPLAWQWIYTVNGGPEIALSSGSGPVANAVFNYTASTAGKTYVWKLRVSNGNATAESTFTVGVEAPPLPAGTLSFSATSGTITAPFVISGGTNGYIYQSAETGVTNGGRATYSFSITNAGNYVVQASVNAPNASANSIYLNIDAEPQDPAMIWDIPLTTGFELLLANQRGNGTFDNDQFVPMIYNLGVGTHQIIVIGREANVQLQSLSILQLPPPPQNLHIVPGS